MATASGSGQWLARGVHRTQWTLTGTVTIGRPATLAALPDKTLHVFGTFGAGGSITLEGSNLLASSTGISATGNWSALNDTRGEGNPLTFTTPQVVQVLENPNLIRPRMTSVSAGTSLKVVMISQSTRR